VNTVGIAIQVLLHDSAHRSDDLARNDDDFGIQRHANGAQGRKFDIRPTILDP
jgi:hypothetical protein